MSSRIKKPYRRRPQGIIAVVSPSGPVERKNILNSIDKLKRYGLEFKILPGTFKKEGYLAGSDSIRLSALKEALTDKRYGAVICSRGGYGSIRLLDAISRIKQLRVRPFFGFSDITALHIFLNNLGWVTFHSPNLNGFLQLKRNTQRLFIEALKGDLDFTKMEYCVERVIKKGISKGRLIGGNLSVFSSLSGTRFDPDLRQKILFLEDVDEKPYRIDRMLTQLRLRADFNKLKGIVFGRFCGCGSKEEIIRIITQFAKDIDIPIVYGIKAGHIMDNLVLPLNIEYLIDTRKRVVIPQEGPFL